MANQNLKLLTSPIDTTDLPTSVGLVASAFSANQLATVAADLGQTPGQASKTTSAYAKWYAQGGSGNAAQITTSNPQTLRVTVRNTSLTQTLSIAQNSVGTSDATPPGSYESVPPGYEVTYVGAGSIWAYLASTTEALIVQTIAVA